MTWTVQEAKAKLSEVLKRAREGEPQFIGAKGEHVVISREEFDKLRPIHFGRYLLETAPVGAEIELPSRRTKRGDPFARGGKR